MTRPDNDLIIGFYKYACKAAQQQSAGEIAELKAIIELDKNIEAQEITALKAHNERLREALEVCKWDCNTGEVIQIAAEALAKTPAQCLIEHDNEVIERCALALENAEGELKYLPEYVALLRKLKG